MSTKKKARMVSTTITTMTNGYICTEVIELKEWSSWWNVCIFSFVFLFLLALANVLRLHLYVCECAMYSVYIATNNKLWCLSHVALFYWNCCGVFSRSIFGSSLSTTFFGCLCFTFFQSTHLFIRILMHFVRLMKKKTAHVDTNTKLNQTKNRN